MTLECKICLIQHDEEIHAATLRVHEWFRAQVTKYLNDGAGNTISIDEDLEAPQLNAA